MQIHVFDESIKKFIKSLEKPTRAKLIHSVELLEKFNYKLSLPHCKKISDNLFELRIYGEQKARILYTFHKNQIILLHGFVKKSSRIPQKELKIGLKKLNKLTS